MTMTSRDEVLSVQTPAWVLKLKTASVREKPLDDLYRFLRRSESDAPLVAGLEVRSPGWEPPSVPLPPTVFENRIYSLSVRPAEGWTVISVGHPVRKDVEDSLDCEDGVWRGSIRTGNDIGWFSLEITVQPVDGGKSRTDSVAWQVWPLKLDFDNDLKALTGAVEKDYPLWLFKFGAPTVHDVGRTNRRQDGFLLLWAAQFQSLWQDLERGLRIVVQNPHVALEAHLARLRADRLKGRIAPRLEELVVEGRGRPDLRYGTELWRSSRDTPENRFVVHALDSCVSGLERFRRLVDRPELSPSFLKKLDGWIRSVNSFRADPTFRGLGPFTGLTSESLVLHNRAGYATVYRAWLGLRRQLEFFARASSARVGMRGISDLYEVWCFLELRDILTELGFRLRERKAPRWRRGGLEREFENGAGAAFEFDGPDGLCLSLSHEPVFSRVGKRNLHSFTVVQRPDIVIEAAWPATDESPGRRLLWIFDAKYRLKEGGDPGVIDRDEGRDNDTEYLVPPDALDQMHRYRDSIMLMLEGERSRPVVSAFALYPGLFDQSRDPSENPYADAIAEVGIGAFPLVPAAGGGKWLRSHLAQALGVVDAATVTGRPSVRIPVSGLEYLDEDVLLVYLGSDRDKEDLRRFREGRAEGYHIYVKDGPDPSRLDRVRFLAVIDVPGEGGAPRCIRGVYPVDERSIRRRSTLGSFATGTPIPKHAGDDCHYLALGRYLQLVTPILVPREGGNWFRYASLHHLFEARTLTDLWAVGEFV